MVLSLLSIFEDFSNFAREINDFKLKIIESLLIASDKPVLNKADPSLPLELHTLFVSNTFISNTKLKLTKN